MKQKFVELYMDWAERVSKLSHAKRLNVGAVIVKDDSVISYGYNGMPAGWDNNCEDKEYMSGDAGGWLDPEEIKERWPFEEEEQGPYYEYTRSSQSGTNASIFITHAPCMDCAKLIYQSGISSVYYRNSYRDVAGVNFLKLSGVEVKQIEDEQS
jgi:dCMP deaminase